MKTKNKKHWKDIWNMESKEAYWEVTHHKHDQMINLQYFPDENSDGDEVIEIPLTYEKFKDLVKFIKRIS